MLTPRQMKMLSERELTAQMCVHNVHVHAYVPENEHGPVTGAPGLFVVRFMGHLIFPGDFGDDEQAIPDNRLAVHEIVLLESEFEHLNISLTDALSDYRRECGTPTTELQNLPGTISPDAFARMIEDMFPGIIGDIKREDENGERNRD